jgi:hypothetical protein
MSDKSSLMSKLKSTNQKLTEQIRLMPEAEMEKLNHGDCLAIAKYWRGRCLSLEKWLLEISSCPTDSWAWRELRKRTALQALGLNPDGAPAQDAEDQ